VSGSRTVSGTLRLADAVAPGAIVRVKVEDVSRLDAAAVVIAEAVLPLASGAAAGADIPFSITVPAADEAASYGVRAHVDTTGSGDISPGDLVSNQAYPVLTQGHPDRVLVEARKI
jgi:uncharacterized lipoprotein YbaY